MTNKLQQELADCLSAYQREFKVKELDSGKIANTDGNLLTALYRKSEKALENHKKRGE